MKFTLGLTAVFVLGSTATQTWPSPVFDEMEDLMYLLNGYNSRGFASGVVPCSKSPPGTSGRTASAEWIRTAFHDAMAGNVFSKQGGMDGSIQYETGYGENIGPGFVSTLQAMSPFVNSRASLADLLSLGMSAATRSCGGPIVPLRVGRKDATVASPLSNVPLPQNSGGTFVNQFSYLGFSTADMIAAVACGHSIGGVHSSNFPAVVAPKSDGSDTYSFADSTQAVMDNKIVTEYFDDTSKDPMLRGLCTKGSVCSDSVVFKQDGNATMNSLRDANVFQSKCADVFQRMMEVVPATTTLSANTVEPYEVKPDFQMTLLDGGKTLGFVGEIRVRTTNLAQSQIQSVQLNYVDRSGGSSCGSCVIMATPVGTASGLDDTFTFYKFSASIPALTSISAFKVQVNQVGGKTQTYDNNGLMFPVQDQMMLQTPQSCVKDGTMNVVAAVRTSLLSNVPPAMVVTVPKTQNGNPIPLLSSKTQSMTQGDTYNDLYTLFSTSYTMPTGSNANARFDLISGVGTIADSFKNSGDLGSVCSPLKSSDTTSTTDTSTDTAPVILLDKTEPDTTTDKSTTTTTPTTLQKVANKTPATTPTSTGWNRIGCYVDDRSYRTLKDFVSVPAGGDGMTIEACQSEALRNGYTYAGLENGRECWAYTSIQNNGPATDGDAGCSVPCTGDATEQCGGDQKLNVFQYVAPPTGWNRLGCYTDDRSYRTLKDFVSVPGGGDNMTIEGCQSEALAHGYTYAGLEFGRECWAYTSIQNNGGPAPNGESSCSLKCTGDATENCGAADFLNIFKYYPDTSKTTSKPTTTTTSLTTTATSTTTTTPVNKPASTPIDTSGTKAAPGWTVMGCYTDSQSARSLGNQIAIGDGATMTNANCQKAAQVLGYLYAGTEYHSECWAGNVLPSTAQLADDQSTCNTPCQGDGSEMCGGPDRVTIAMHPAQSFTKVAAGWSYIGCYTDPVVPRALANNIDTANGNNKMTNYDCQMAAQAKGYKYAGTEYGYECWGANELTSGAAVASDGEAKCTKECSGASDGEVCGGPERLSMWSFTGSSQAIPK